MTYDYCDTIASQAQLGSDAQILKTNDMKLITGTNRSYMSYRATTVRVP